MIKSKKWLMNLMVGTTLMGTGLVAGVVTTQSVQPATVQAKTKMTMKTFPKRYRRTWYHYAGKGKYNRISFTSKTYKWTFYDGGEKDSDTGYVHVRKATADPDKAKIHNSWIDSRPWHFRKAHWICLYGWNQSNGGGTYYKVTTRTYKGKHYRVLTSASGAGWVDGFYFKTKKAAKKIGNHRFKGEPYVDSH